MASLISQYEQALEFLWDIEREVGGDGAKAT